MTQNDIKLAVITVNDALSTNNPKGLTEALKNIGYPVDKNFDILSHDALTKALLDLYIANPSKWAEVMQSVEFNYEKTDSSTSPQTKATFENIIRSLDPSTISSTQKLTFGDFFNKALGLLVGQTTVITPGTPPYVKAQTSVWFYVGLSVIAVVILLIVYFALKTKNI